MEKFKDISRSLNSISNKSIQKILWLLLILLICTFFGCTGYPVSIPPIWGQVVDSGGTGIGSVQVEFIKESTNNSYAKIWTYDGEKVKRGGFRLYVEPGETYTLVFTHQSYQTETKRGVLPSVNMLKIELKP